MTDPQFNDRGEAELAGEGFIRSRGWWRLVAIGLSLGGLGAVGALVFVKVVEVGTNAVWGSDAVSVEPFTGTLMMLGIMAIAGLLVGLIHRFVPSAGDPDVFEGLVTGKFDHRAVPGGLLVSLATLIGGFSLGPEVPTGMLAGGTASAIGQKRGWDPAKTKLGFTSAVTGAYGGLFTSPFVAILLVLELDPPKRRNYIAVLSIEVVAALTGFAVFFGLGGFATLLAELNLPSYQFELWHLSVGVLMGAIGLLGGIITGISNAIFTRLAGPLSNHVVLRGLVAGVGLGLLAMAIPLTLFYGATSLPDVTSQAATIGAGVLLITALAKVVAMTAARSFGFIGGPIFPLVFAGGVLGAAVSVIFPDLPPALTVTAGMAAVPAAILPMPLTLGILAIVLSGTTMELVIPIMTASVVASVLAHGLKRTGPVTDDEVGNTA